LVCRYRLQLMEKTQKYNKGPWAYCCFRQLMKKGEDNNEPSFHYQCLCLILATLVLGLRPRQGVTMLRAKRKT
jgi:hypothetical protein